MRNAVAACFAIVLFTFAIAAETKVESGRGKAKPVLARAATGLTSDSTAPAIRVSKLNGTDGRAHYRVEVTNVEQYPAPWFGPAGPSLPPNPCSETRMVSLVMVRQAGETRKVDCKALRSRDALRTMEFSLAKPLADDDKVQFVLQDRQAETHASSQWFVAGWIGVAAQLAPAGCKSFLGRAGSFLCDASGFAFCERLRKSGKPIACTQAGIKK